MNDSIQIEYGDALAIRGGELVGRPRVLNYDPEGAGDCTACLMREEEGGNGCGDCDEVCGSCGPRCSHESERAYERVLSVREGALVMAPDVCLGDP